MGRSRSRLRKSRNANNQSHLNENNKYNYNKRNLTRNQIIGEEAKKPINYPHDALRN